MGNVKEVFREPRVYVPPMVYSSFWSAWLSWHLPERSPKGSTRGEGRGGLRRTAEEQVFLQTPPSSSDRCIATATTFCDNTATTKTTTATTTGTALERQLLSPSYDEQFLLSKASQK